MRAYVLVWVALAGCWRDAPVASPPPKAREPAAISVPNAPGQCQAVRKVGTATDGVVTAADLEHLVEAQGPATRCCWLKARHRKVDDTKVTVTLTVAPDGVVGEVELSDAEPALKTCLRTVVEGWRFEPAKRGTYRFAMMFAD